MWKTSSFPNEIGACRMLLVATLCTTAPATGSRDNTPFQQRMQALLSAWINRSVIQKLEDGKLLRVTNEQVFWRFWPCWRVIV